MLFRHWLFHPELGILDIGNCLFLCPLCTKGKEQSFPGLYRLRSNQIKTKNYDYNRKIFFFFFKFHLRQNRNVNRYFIWPYTMLANTIISIQSQFASYMCLKILASENFYVVKYAICILEPYLQKRKKNGIEIVLKIFEIVKQASHIILFWKTLF